MYLQYTRKLVAPIEQRIMLEKALGQVKVDPDWDLPDPDENRMILLFTILCRNVILRSTCLVRLGLSREVRRNKFINRPDIVLVNLKWKLRRSS